jgi:hypothetical protein
MYEMKSVTQKHILYFENISVKVKVKGKVYPCTGTEALYRPYGKVHPCTGTEALYRPYGL